MKPSLVSRRRMLPFIPVTGFAAVAGALGLNRDAKLTPSALIGRNIPKFDLPPVKGRSLGLSNSSLVGEVSLANVFASWCVPYRAEDPVFMAIKLRNVVPLHGLN
jgi:cytochrome c biogenesis protein CcmG/thiol:disulfide interchange protein DsbE